jgi:hypothetical protein
MVARKPTKRDMSVKAKVLAGHSRNKVARSMGLAPTTVRRIVNRLVALNELRPVPGTANPVTYEDPRNPAGFEVRPASGKTVQNATYVINQRIPFEDHGPEEVRVHLKGFIRFVVHHVGDHNTVRDAQETVMADWDGTTYPKGRIDRQGTLSAFGYLFKFEHRSGNKGSETLAFWPQDVWVHEKDKPQGVEILLDRARYLAQLLKPHNWVFSDPEIRGRIHYARNNPAMVELYQKITPSDDAEAETDTSPDVPEFETFDEKDDDLLNHLPSNIYAIKADISRIDKEEAELRASNRALRMEILRVENFLLERDLTTKEILLRNLTEPNEASRPGRVPAEAGGMFA